MAVKGKRIFNYRPVCFAALGMTIGVIVGEALYGEALALIALPISLAIIATVLLIAFKKTRKLFYIPLALLVGFAGITVANAVYDSHLLGDTYRGNITATVVSEVIVDDGDEARTCFYVSDIYIDGKCLKGRASVALYFAFEPDFNAGDIISLHGTLRNNAHERFGTSYSYFVSNRQYFSIYADSVTKLSEGKPSFPVNVQMKIKQLLFENIRDDTTAQICQGMLLGDTFGLDDSLRSQINDTGLAHLLAVSGLHITALATALYFLLKKLKVNPKISFVAVTVLTFLYVMLCSFTASALRAFIMSGVFSFADAFGRKKDRLSTLSLAAVLILLFRPSSLMGKGFLMSFFSLLGICLFYDSFRNIGMKAVERISPKRHIGTKVVEIVSVSLAVNLTATPIVLLFFGKVSTLFLLSNLIIVPYMVLIYVFLLIITLFSLITTLSGVVWIMRYLLIPFRVYTHIMSGMPFAYVSIPVTVTGVICYTLILIMLSRFIFLSRRQKVREVLIGSSLSLVLCTLMLLAV